MRLYVDGVLVGQNAVTTAQAYNGLLEGRRRQPERLAEPSQQRQLLGQHRRGRRLREGRSTPARVFAHYAAGHGHGHRHPGADGADRADRVGELLEGVAGLDRLDRQHAGHRLPDPPLDGAELHPERGHPGGPGRRHHGDRYRPERHLVLQGRRRRRKRQHQRRIEPGDGHRRPTPRRRPSPTALAATPYGDQVDLTWTASTDDTGVTGLQRLPVGLRRRRARARRHWSAPRPRARSPTPACPRAPGTTRSSRSTRPGTPRPPRPRSAPSRPTASTNIDFDAVDTLAPTPTFTSTQQSSQHDRRRDAGRADRPEADLPGRRATSRSARRSRTRCSTSRPRATRTPGVRRRSGACSSPPTPRSSRSTPSTTTRRRPCEVKVDGHRTTALPRNIGGTTLGSRMVYKVDFGSAATRTVTLEVYLTPFGGIYLPPGATLTKAAPLTTRWMVLGDSITAARTRTRPAVRLLAAEGRRLPGLGRPVEPGHRRHRLRRGQRRRVEEADRPRRQPTSRRTTRSGS